MLGLGAGSAKSMSEAPNSLPAGIVKPSMRPLRGFGNLAEEIPPSGSALADDCEVEEGRRRCCCSS